MIGGKHMHIAICDDNVADRKHLERLLSRESAKRAGTPNVLYVHSYGDQVHFLRNPLRYDLIFLDMTATPTATEEIIKKLVQMGLNAPLILYSSKIDYTLLTNLPENVVHMQKPYIQSHLPKLLKLGDARACKNIDTIAIPCDDGIQYIPKDNICYCMSNHSGYLLGLADGTQKNMAIDIGEFQILILPYKEFCRITKKHIINMQYVAKITPISVLMQDHKKFNINPFRYSEFKNLKEELDEIQKT